VKTAPRLRALAPLLVAAGIGLATFVACSYDPLKGDILLHVSGVPATAVRAVVTLTPINGTAAVEFKPQISPGGALDLALTAPAGTYAFAVQVQAFDGNSNDADIVGDGTVSSPPVTFPDSANPVSFNLSLVPVGADGTFSARCIIPDAGGLETCLNGLICVTYQAGQRGVCTQTCTADGGTTCPTSVIPVPSCQPNGPALAACQWECDLFDGGTTFCPPGLVCGAQDNSTKKFCQPLPQ
jgi:hypothetical protein